MDLHDQPSTKAVPQAPVADLKASEQRLYDRMDLMEQRIADRLAEALRGRETRLIQAFDAFAQVNNRRLKQAEWIRLPPLG